VVWTAVLLLGLSGGQALAAENPAESPQSIQPVGPVSPAFPDVPRNHWAFEAVEKVRKAGIMIGYPDGTFGGAAAWDPGQAGSLSQRAVHHPRLGAGHSRLEKAQPLGTDTISAVVWAKWLSVPALAGFLNPGEHEPGAAPGPTEYLPFHHWAYDAIQRLVDLGSFIGLPSDPFGYHAPYAPYQFAQALSSDIHRGALSDERKPPPARQEEVAALWAKLLQEFWAELEIVEELARPGLRERLEALPEGHWFRAEARRLLAEADKREPRATDLMPLPAPPEAEPLPPDHRVYDTFAKLADLGWPTAPVCCNRQQPLSRHEAARGWWRSVEVPASAPRHLEVPRNWEVEALPLLTDLARELRPELELLEKTVGERDGMTLCSRLEALPPEHWFRGAAQALLAEIRSGRDDGAEPREGRMTPYGRPWTARGPTGGRSRQVAGSALLSRLNQGA